MTSKLIIVVLLLALLIVCGKLYMGASGRKAPANDVTDALTTILTRSSVRAYTDQSVEQDKIEKLLRAGMAAPSACDKRPWHFVVVTDKQQLKGLAEANPNASYADSAPLAIVVCGDMSKTLQGVEQQFWIQDCSAASENILLAAHAMGLGAVWAGTYPAAERCQAVARVLNLPSHLVPLNTIVIGYPSGEAHAKDKWDAANVTFNKFK